MTKFAGDARLFQVLKAKVNCEDLQEGLSKLDARKDGNKVQFKSV